MNRICLNFHGPRDIGMVRFKYIYSTFTYCFVRIQSVFNRFRSPIVLFDNHGISGPFWIIFRKGRIFSVQNNALVVFSFTFLFHREEQVQLKMILNRLVNIALPYFFNIKNNNYKRTKLLVFFQPIKARVEISNGLK